MAFTNDDAIAKLPKERQEKIRKAIEAEIEKYRREGLLKDKKD